MTDISVKPEFSWIARLGYTARGVIYLIIGGLALLAMSGNGGKTTGSKGALSSLRNEPFGDTIIIALIAGLLCYSVWRTIQSIKDSDNHGTGFKALAIRGGLLISAITHLSLAYWATTLIIGDSSSSSNSTSDSLLSHTMGQILFSVVGICVFGAGIAHFIKGWKAGFEKHMAIPMSHRYWAKPVCQFGLISRGLVYCIIGSFIFFSAWYLTSKDIESIGAALEWLRVQPFGSWLLGFTAVGLFAFGIYSILEACFRRIQK